jgi:RNA polymerase sigma-70 factor, ECF subfamily
MIFHLQRNKGARGNEVREVELPVSGTDDAELARLMRRASTGDEQAYADFLRRTAALVRGFCRRRITSGSIDPEDVVQETLLAIHLKRHTWRQNDPIMPWVYGIARFKLTDAFRRRGRHIEVEIAQTAETLAAPETEPSHSQEVERALEALSTGQKAVVSSISVEGRSIRETAERLSMTEAAVRVALHRGLATISRRFGRN